MPLLFLQVLVSRLRENTSAYCSRMSDRYAAMKTVLREDSKGWQICAAVLVVTVVRSGITYSFGIFIVELESQYHKPMAEQNWIGTLSFCISLSCAPISVAFIRSLKHRGYLLGGLIGTVVLSASCLGSSFVQSVEMMFLTHSLLYGVGSSLIYMASSLVIGEYFDKHHKYHVMATSILLCGYPIGSLMFNPINAWLVTRFGWRVAFRVASGLIMLGGGTCCWSFTSKESPNMQRLEEETEEEPVVDEVVSPSPRKFLNQNCCTLQDIKHRPEIVLWYCANCISYLGFYMPFVNLAFYMDRKKIPPLKSSWALTMLSLFECITYMFASFYGDYLKGKLVYINIFASGGLAVICILWPFVDVTFGVIIVIAVCMGAFLGLTIVYTYAASGEVTELPIDVAWSCTNLWSGIGILVGPFFSGAIFDFRGSYDDVFYIVGALYIVDVLLFAGIPIIKNRRQKREQLKTEYNEITGIVGDRQTYKISTKRSISKSSLVNEDGGGEGGDEVGQYGTTATTTTQDYTTPRANSPPATVRETEQNGIPFRVGHTQQTQQNQNYFNTEPWQ